MGIFKPCVDEKDTSKKCENKVIQCGRKDGVVTNKARKSWIFQNDLSFQKFYAPEMQNPPFADGVNSLSTNPRQPAFAGSPGEFTFPPLLHLLRLSLSVSALQPINSVSYVIAAILGNIFFQEAISIGKAAGIVVIMAGVILLAQEESVS